MVKQNYEHFQSQQRVCAEYLICPNPSEELKKFCDKNKLQMKKSLFDLKLEEIPNLSKIKILKSDVCTLSMAFGYFMHFPIVEVKIAGQTYLKSFFIIIYFKLFFQLSKNKLIPTLIDGLQHQALNEKFTKMFDFNLYSSVPLKTSQTEICYLGKLFSKSKNGFENFGPLWYHSKKNGFKKFIDLLL